MKKRVLAVMLLGAVLLAGCGSKGDGATASGNSDAGATGDVTSETDDVAEDTAVDGDYMVFDDGTVHYTYKLYTDSDDLSGYEYHFTKDDGKGGTMGDTMVYAHGKADITNYKPGDVITSNSNFTDFHVTAYDFNGASDNYLQVLPMLEKQTADLDNVSVGELASRMAQGARYDGDSTFRDEAHVVEMRIDIRKDAHSDSVAGFGDSVSVSEATESYDTEMNGYDVNIQTYEPSSNMPTHGAWIRLSDDYLICVTFWSVPNDDVEAVLQKYIFDAMDL